MNADLAPEKGKKDQIKRHSNHATVAVSKVKSGYLAKFQMHYDCKFLSHLAGCLWPSSCLGPGPWGSPPDQSSRGETQRRQGCLAQSPADPGFASSRRSWPPSGRERASEQAGHWDRLDRRRWTLGHKRAASGAGPNPGTAARTWERRPRVVQASNT